jgi:hypothetical protein
MSVRPGEAASPDLERKQQPLDNTDAVVAKKQRVAASSAPQVVNSLRLVPHANLPHAIELQVLALLPFDDIGRLLLLSRDMHSVVKAHFEQLRSFDLPHYDDDEEVIAELYPSTAVAWEGMRTSVSLLRHCCQLARLSLLAGFLRAPWPRLDSLFCDTIRRNSRTLTDCTLGKCSLSALSALETCAGLTGFFDVPVQQQSASGAFPN